MGLGNFSPFLPALAMLLATVVVDAQNAPALAGRWEGTLVFKTPRGSRELSTRSSPPRLPMVAIITTAADGTHSGTWGGTGGVTPIGGVTIEGDTIRIDVPAWRGSWEGTLSSDGSTLEGRWRQNGSTSPLVLKKTGTQ